MSFSIPIFTRPTLEHGVLEHVETWITPYLAQIERQEELDPQTLATPKSWDVKTDFTRRPEDTLPLVAVVSTGTNPGMRPRQEGDGTLTAWWLVAIGAVVSASSQQAAKDLAGYYGAAIRGLMQEDIEWANGVDWNSEVYDDLPAVAERTLAAARLVFTVEVNGVMSAFDGFDGVPEDPYADPAPTPTVKSGGATADVEPMGDN